MLNKIEKVFKKVTETVCPRTFPLKFNKGWVGAVFFFVFLGLALPSQFAQAGILDILASIPIMIITLLLQVVLAVSNLILGLTGAILGWVTGPNFITLPYTREGVVDVGWPIVRDFINMFFIIALVVIGLATALRIKEYQFQKTLPTLVLIAILINFTPVICGLIIDASNILMNFFLEKLTGFQLMRNFFSMQGSTVWEALSHPFNLSYASTALGKTIVMIAFSLGIPKVFWGASYIFIMYSLLFIMRYVMLWALVIVSPIAFFSKIFPGSQKYLFKSILGWDEWWKEFIEWSLVGVIAGFFLFLGEQLMMKAPGMISGLPPTGSTWGLSNPFVEFFNNFLPWMVVLVFLWLGYKITKEISAMGAQGAMKAVDTGVKLIAGSALAAATLGVGAAGLAGLMGKASAVAGRADAFLGKRGITKPLQGLVGKPMVGLTRGIERVTVPTLQKYALKSREAKIPSEFDKLTPDEQARMTAAQLTSRGQVQYAAKMAELKTLGKVNDPELKKRMRAITGKAESLADKSEFKKAAGDIADALPDEITKKLKINLESTPEDRDKMEKKINEQMKDIKAKILVDVDLKNEIEKGAIEKGLSEDQYIENVAAGVVHAKGLKPGDIPQVTKGSLDSVQFRLASQEMSSQHLQRIQTEWGKETLDKVLNNTGGLNTMFVGKDDKKNKEILEEFYLRNPRMVHFLNDTPAGREMAWEGRKYVGKFDDFVKEMEPRVTEQREKRQEEERKKVAEEGTKREKDEKDTKEEKFWRNWQKEDIARRKKRPRGSPGVEGTESKEGGEKPRGSSGF